MINFEEKIWFLRLNVETYQNSQNFAASQEIKVIPNVETYQLHLKNKQYVIAASLKNFIVFETQQ